MPRTLGDSFIHVSELNCIVEYEEKLLEVPPSPPDDVSQAIARHISRLIENGSTIQAGIGKIPNAVLYHLSDKKDLGVHTCMFFDGIIDLIEAGVINNSKKTFHPGKILASFCAGTRRLYDYVDNNPIFEFRPTDYTSSPLNIAKNHKMVAINTALEIDLTGQVCASSLGYRIYSGIGGQADFMRGAALAPQGKPIIALPSTAQNDTISRIVPHLSEGAGVETTRGDVHYIATEYEVAYLHGKSLRERAVALTNIAHPKFRDELMVQAKAHKYLYEDQIIPSESVAIDYYEKMGIVGVHGASGSERILANGYWIRNSNNNMAEISFAVADDYQRRGIGTHLLLLLMSLGKEQEIRGFEVTVITGNVAMMNVFKRSCCVLHSEYDSGMYTLHFNFDEKITE